MHLNNVAGSSVIVVIKYYFEIAKAANIKNFLLHQDICRILKNGVDYNFGFLQGSIPSFGQSFDILGFIYFAYSFLVGFEDLIGAGRSIAY